MLPVIAIIGRPNVGKSTLFNALIGQRKAIVSHVAGTTRDRIYQKIKGQKVDYMLVDTGGLDFQEEGIIETNVQLQAQVGISEADLLVFVLDAKEDLTALDAQVVNYLRKNAALDKVIVVTNKCDRVFNMAELSEFLSLGLGEPLQVSATHKRGLGDLQKQIETKLQECGFNQSSDYKNSPGQETTIKVALVGKPNVGKSSLINAYLNSDKLIVSDIAGTTVDATDTLIKYEGKSFTFIDTAGIRRKGKIQPGIEKYSIIRVFDSIDQADVVCMLLDGSEKVSKQDQHIIEVITKAHPGLILIVNKWDTQEKGEEAKNVYFHYLRSKFAFIPWAPVIFLSAKTKRNIVKIFPLIESIYQERQKRITTGRLNDFIEKITRKHLPTGTKNVRPKIMFGQQVNVAPPHFRIYVNQLKYFHFSYLRYFENRLREEFGFAGTGIKIEWVERPPKGKKRI